MSTFTVALIDNRDSFTRNLASLAESCGAKTDIYRCTITDISILNTYSHLILSPGPGLPEEAGSLLNIIKEYRGKIPILGVCLGHQAIGLSAGMTMKRLEKVYHGEISVLEPTDGSLLFRNIPKVPAGRYHSWVLDKNFLPENFSVTAKDENGEIMALENQTERLYGVQFHPESYMTEEEGKKIMKNFLENG